MRVIDLLNKIANGEEVPKKIKFHSQHYLLTNGAYGDYKDYISTLTDNYLFDDEWNLTGNLNEEVEIIEEDKEIDKINIGPLNSRDDLQRQIEVVHYENVMIANAVNEIIDKINKGE